MMDRLILRTANWIAENGGSTKDIPIYAYVLEHLLMHLATLVTVLTISALCGVLPAALAWYIFFLPLRQTAGGNHAGTRLSCFVLSLLIAFGCIVLSEPAGSWRLLPPAAWSFSVIVVWLWAPVIHPNHPIPPVRIPFKRRVSRWIVLLEGLALLILWLLGLHVLAAAGAWGMLAASVSTCIGHFQLGQPNAGRHGTQ